VRLRNWKGIGRVAGPLVVRKPSSLVLCVAMWICREQHFASCEMAPGLESTHVKSDTIRESQVESFQDAVVA
jgi:hypothetical protein